MKQLTGNQVRQMFLDYFKSKGHMIEPGASLIPHNDPTLLWINAGVAALKKYFDGSEKPASNRIANAQKSIRTNDIENVVKYIGKTENIDVNKYLIIYQDTEGTWDAWDPITETFVLLSEENHKVAMGKYIAKLSEQYAISK